jgi:hypothetical protein
MIVRLATVAMRVLLLTFGLAAVVGIWGEQAPAWAQAQDELYIADAGFDSILVYPRTATGNTAPLRKIIGAATGLTGPGFLAVDLVHNELVVANLIGASITV